MRRRMGRILMNCWGNWAKLETMRASHPIYFARKLADEVARIGLDSLGFDLRDYCVLRNTSSNIVLHLPETGLFRV
ncbi:hypothetical protein ACET3Z_010857 [Daucus carota]